MNAIMVSVNASLGGQVRHVIHPFVRPSGTKHVPVTVSANHWKARTKSVSAAMAGRVLPALTSLVPDTTIVVAVESASVESVTALHSGLASHALLNRVRKTAISMVDACPLDCACVMPVMLAQIARVPVRDCAVGTEPVTPHLFSATVAMGGWMRTVLAR